jgi:hypothetical protein
MKRAFLFFLFFLSLSFFWVEKALAVCPICTVAAGAGVGFSRWLGIDDTITGLWLGGLIVSLISWTENWLEKKNIRFKGRALVDTIFYYGVVIISLYYSGLVGHPQNKLFCFCGFNVDKLIFGVLTGSIAFWFGANWYYYLKEKRGKAYFPFQKVIMPIVPLVILSLIFYYLTK